MLYSKNQLTKKIFLHPKRNKDEKFWGNASLWCLEKILGCFFWKYSLKKMLLWDCLRQQTSFWQKGHPFCSLMRKGPKINHVGITITFNQNFVNVFLRDQSLVQVEKVFQRKHSFGKLTVVKHVQLLNGPFKHCFCLLYFCKKSSERILLVTKN